MKKILCLLAALGGLSLATASFATELFPGGKPYDFPKAGEVLAEGSTLGGYAIYQGDERWVLNQLTTRTGNATGDAVAVNTGTARLDQFSSKGWTARMFVSANLSAGLANQYALGNPCAGSHLIAINKGRGQDDNCLTVDPDSGDTDAGKITMLVLQVIHTKSSGRKYRITLFMNLEKLHGFAGTQPSDWTPAAVATVPERAAFVRRLQEWGVALQDASERALDFKKPQDVFNGILPFRTLAPELGATSTALQ